MKDPLNITQTVFVDVKTLFYHVHCNGAFNIALLIRPPVCIGEQRAMAMRELCVIDGGCCAGGVELFTFKAPSAKLFLRNPTIQVDVNFNSGKRLHMH